MIRWEVAHLGLGVGGDGWSNNNVSWELQTVGLYNHPKLTELLGESFRSYWTGREMNKYNLKVWVRMLMEKM
jgi:hypothetical protein